VKTSCANASAAIARTLSARCCTHEHETEAGLESVSECERTLGQLAANIMSRVQQHHDVHRGGLADVGVMPK
jgi:ornithine carbamoyltransferase